MSKASSATPDDLVWTEEGRATLEAQRAGRLPQQHELSTSVLQARVASAVARFAPAWKRGLSRSDARAQQAIIFHHDALATGVLPAKLSVDDAAWSATLLGAYESEMLAPFVELLLRQRGAAFCVRVLVAMWGQRSNYHNPDWPRGEARLELWAGEMAADHGSAHDASVSYGKATFADYLQRARASLAAEQLAALEQTVDELWPSATLPAKAPLALVADDARRAAELVDELEQGDLAAHYAWWVLPYVLRDVPRLERMLAARHTLLDLRILDNLGAEVALPLYEAQLRSRIPNTLRIRLVTQLVNIRGPRTAQMLARYVEKAPFTKVVRAYFVRYPELLAQVIATPDADVDVERLATLAGRVQSPPAANSPKKTAKKATRKKA